VLPACPTTLPDEVDAAPEQPLIGVAARRAALKAPSQICSARVEARPRIRINWVSRMIPGVGDEDLDRPPGSSTA
jgi:hypothetical protein